jgi:predicted O-methyltransferase YrrM
MAPGGRVSADQVGPPNFDNLLALTAEDLQKILASPQIDRAWSLYGPILAELCEIQDLKTGGVNPGDRRALFYLVSALRPKKVLEIGTNVGASTIHIAAALDANDAEVGTGRLVTVDIEDVNDSPTAPWKLAGLPLSARQRIEEFNGRTEVTFVTAASLDFLEHTSETFDCIFLDGDHSEEVVFAELIHASRLLDTGGVIILHDFFPGHRPLWPGGGVDHGPVGATERLRSIGAAIDVLPLGALPWPTKFNSNVTSLAVVAQAAQRP